jgi:hypothetical protein
MISKGTQATSSSQPIAPLGRDAAGGSLVAVISILSKD